nr:MAG TPA: hypothetical protein [Caudoviricetes sp.]
MLHIPKQANSLWFMSAKAQKTAETTKTAYMPDRMKCFCQR